MESENIKYMGITQATTDLDCQDGELSVSHNIINHNGAMRPIILPEVEFTLKEGEILLYVHSTSSYKNFIYKAGSNIKAFTISEGARKDYSVSFPLDTNEDINKIESVGNTLVVITTNSIYYSLFKDNEYIYLGGKAPELQMSFGLRGQLSESPVYDIDLSQNKIAPSFGGFIFVDEAAKQISDQLTPKINEFINGITNHGLFSQPFFVRYAYRTITGAYMQSPPVYMMPNSGAFPYIPLTNQVNSDEVLKKANVCISCYVCRLDYRIPNFQSTIEQLKKWSDIITSIDIYISEPISNYNQDSDTYYFSLNKMMFPPFYGKSSNGGTLRTEEDANYVGRGVFNKAGISFINPPQKPEEDIEEKTRNTSVFKKVYSFKIDELKESDYIKTDGEILSNLGVQETLTDDYNSHDQLHGEYSYIYNSRLNLSNIKRLPYGFPINTLTTYNNGYLNEGISQKQEYSYKLYFFIKYNGSDIISTSESSLLYRVEQYLFYPNPNAYKIIIERTDTFSNTKEYAELLLSEHIFLNGSYYYNPSNQIKYSSDFDTAILNGKEKYIYEKNKIYTSEANNPFLFPLEGINTIGVGQILGMSSTTRALSQGQFGQFPLLVFATDGIWAMEVSQTGLYSTKQPISRDVCSNPQSITQIDGAVVFISNKGAMMVNAGEVNTFSAELDGPSFIPASVVKFDTIAEKEGLTKELSALIPVKDFLAGCQIAYDYPNSRLFFINANKSYAYAYSLESRSWATVSSSFTRVVTDYPHSYLQSSNQGVVNISTKTNFDSSSRVKSIILSRPIKLGDDMLKTVNQIINRGGFQMDKINVVLFASTDGNTYFPIGSAKGPKLSGLCGSPYRYFRIAVISNFSAQESLSATSVFFTPKWRNKPR